MKTEDLIAALSQDTQKRAGPMQALGGAMLPALAVSMVFYFAALNFRRDLLGSLTDPAILGKFVLPALVIALMFPVMRAMTRPQVQMRAGVLIALPILALIVVALGFLTTPSGLRMQGWLGGTILPCLMSIPAISLSILAAMLWGMRAGAVTQPRLAGAMAGLVAGGIGALIYATHCTEDNPMFYGTWYTLGIAIVAGIGAALGPRVLRW